MVGAGVVDPAGIVTAETPMESSLSPTCTKQENTLAVVFVKKFGTEPIRLILTVKAVVNLDVVEPVVPEEEFGELDLGDDGRLVERVLQRRDASVFTQRLHVILKQRPFGDQTENAPAFVCLSFQT